MTNQQEPFQLTTGVLTLTDVLKIVLAVMCGIVLGFALLHGIEEEWASVPVTPVEQSGP